MYMITLDKDFEMKKRECVVDERKSSEVDKSKEGEFNRLLI